jgi:hypothetical protein
MATELTRLLAGEAERLEFHPTVWSADLTGDEPLVGGEAWRAMAAFFGSTDSTPCPCDACTLARELS